MARRNSGSATILGIVLLILGTLSMYYFAFFTGGLSEAMVAMLHWTGRLSLILFLCVFLASPLARFNLNLGRSLVKNRRYIGISMGLSHLLHLYCLFLYLNLPGVEPPSQVFNTFGLFGFIILGIMVLTSNNFSQRILGGLWKATHTLGIMYLWATFIIIYGSEVVESRSPLAITVMALLIIFGAIRLYSNNIVTSLTKPKPETSES